MLRHSRLFALILSLVSVNLTANAEPQTSSALVLIGVIGESQKGESALAVIKDVRSGKTLFVKEGEDIKALGLKVTQISNKQVLLNNRGVEEIVRFEAGNAAKTSRSDDSPGYSSSYVGDDAADAIDELTKGRSTYPEPTKRRHPGKAYPVNRTSKNTWDEDDDEDDEDDDEGDDDDIDISDDGDPVPEYNGRDPDSDSETVRW